MPYEGAAARRACFACRAPSTTASPKPRSDPVMDMFRPKIWKIVVLYSVAAAGMILPAPVGLALAFGGPPPYLLREDGLGSEWAEPTPHDYPDGSSVTVYAYPDEPAAREGAGAVLKA